jgi:hypothetical protein
MLNDASQLMGVYQDFDQAGPETVPEDQGNDDCVNSNAAKSPALEFARHFSELLRLF